MQYKRVFCRLAEGADSVLISFSILPWCPSLLFWSLWWSSFEEIWTLKEVPLQRIQREDRDETVSCTARDYIQSMECVWKSTFCSLKCYCLIPPSHLQGTLGIFYRNIWKCYSDHELKRRKETQILIKRHQTLLLSLPIICIGPV